MNVPTKSVIRKLVLVEGSKIYIEYHQSSSSIEETSCTKLTLVEESSLANEMQPRAGSVSCLVNKSDERNIRLRPESFPQPASECHSFFDVESWGSIRNEEGSGSVCCSPNVSEISTSSIQSDKNPYTDSMESYGKKNSNESKANRPGRLGDPRMNRAVQAKLDNPDIPLISALVRGGFVFPGLEESKGQLSSVKDIDNVTGE